MKENLKTDKNVKDAKKTEEIKEKTEVAGDKNKVTKLITENKKIFVIIGSIVIVALIITAIICIINGIKYKKYSHYEEKMNAYGFDTLYDNGSAKTSESVTKSEAIKMVIGTCLNTFEIDGFAKKPTDTYENAIWVLYAQDTELVSATNLNKDTQDDKAKYIEVIEYFANAKKILLEKELVSNTNKELVDLAKYTESEQAAILDMLSNDILKVVEKKINGNKNIFKGQLNEIVVNYVEKYNLFGVEIETDVSKLPSNSSEYAYISKNVSKEIYEIPFKVNVEDKTVSPKESFTDLKRDYAQLIDKVEKYYNTILNVDYQTTTVEELKNNLYNLTLANASNTDLNEYVEYLKTNQIKITGSAKVQEPIIYDDGMNYRVRTKLEFKVESSLTNDNLLFGDLGSGETIRYANKDYSVIIDVAFGSAIGTSTYYMQTDTLDLLIVGNDNPGIGKPYATNDFK